MVATIAAIERMVMFTSVPGDSLSVATAVKAFPERIVGYLMLDPTQPGAPDQLREVAGGGDRLSHPESAATALPD